MKALIGIMALTFFSIVNAIVANITFVDTMNLKDLSRLSGIVRSLDIYQLDCKNYPDKLIELKIKKMDCSRAPYVTSIKDNWGNDFKYSYLGQHNKNSYDLSSLGKDGIASEDDINNWDKFERWKNFYGNSLFSNSNINDAVSILCTQIFLLVLFFMLNRIVIRFKYSSNFYKSVPNSIFFSLALSLTSVIFLGIHLNWYSR